MTIAYDYAYASRLLDGDAPIEPPIGKLKTSPKQEREKMDDKACRSITNIRFMRRKKEGEIV